MQHKQKLFITKNMSQLGDHFHKWDLDGDGTLDRGEFYVAVKSLGIDEPTQVADIVVRERHLSPSSP